MRHRVLAAASALGVALLASACTPASGAAHAGTIVAVGAESEYANVIQQVGGKYVAGQRHHEQPEYGPAHLRGQRLGGPDGQPGPARRAERRRL